MSQNKRYCLTDARLKLLSQPGVIYTVRCTGNDCNCKHFGSECRRGFFSLWIQAVYGISFASRLNIDSYIDFGDKPYLYSDPARFTGALNFWNYFYMQEPTPSGGRIVPNNYIETYPLRIWKRKYFRRMHHQVVESLRLRPETQNYIDELISKFNGFKTLGLHVRGTDHPDEVPMVSLEQYHNIVSRSLNRYEKFFVATDDRNVLEALISEFGRDRFVFQDAIRSDNNQAVHTDFENVERFRLGLEVLADCYALAACNKAVLVHSNVSYGALLLNPKLPYRLLETKGSLGSRWKTGLIYTLDRWGIRKM